VANPALNLTLFVPCKIVDTSLKHAARVFLTLGREDLFITTLVSENMADGDLTPVRGVRYEPLAYALSIALLLGDRGIYGGTAYVL
jgi:hypothetical protein